MYYRIGACLVIMLFGANAAICQFTSSKIVSIAAVTQAISIAQDFDGDQQADLFLSGFDGQGFTHKLYKNSQGSFSSNNYSSLLLDGQLLSANAIDYNANGALDLLFTSSYKGKSYIGIYENKNGTLQKKPTVLDAFVYDSIIAYPVNYNNDVYPDFMMLCRNGKTSSVILIENNAGTNFLSHDLNLGNNPLLTCAITKSKTTGQPQFIWNEIVNNKTVTSLYEIDSIGNLQKINAKLPAIVGNLQWLDIDGDNDEDLYVLGKVEANVSHGFLLNNNNDFSTSGFQLPLVRQTSAVFHDFNNDGFKDISLGGKFPNDSTLIKIFTNGGKVFTTGKTITVIDKATQVLGDFDQNNSTELIVMGVNDKNAYTLTSFAAPVKNHTVTFNGPITVTTIKNIAQISWTPPLGLPTATYGYDYQLFKNNVLVIDYKNVMSGATKLLNANRLKLALDLATYKIEIRAFDASGKLSNVQSKEFTINNKDDNATPFDIVKVAGIDAKIMTAGSKIADLNLDGKLDILALTKDSLCVLMLQNGKNYFIPEISFPAEQLEISAIRAQNFHVYYLTKGIIKKYDISKKVHTETGIENVISFKVFDMDNDGDDDIFADSKIDSKAVIYTFTDGEYQKFKLNLLEYKFPFKIADLNNDGYLDIITKKFEIKTVKYSSLVGYNIKGDSITWKSLNSSAFEMLDVVDFDNDDDLDGFGFNNDTYNSCFFANEKGVLSLPSELENLGATGLTREKIKFGNFNDDSIKQLFYFSNNSVYILKQSSLKSYKTNQEMNLGHEFSDYSTVNFMETADFNGDKKVDIFIQYVAEGKLYSLILYNNQPSISAPSTPANTKLTVKNSSVNLSWTAVKGAEYYKIDLWNKNENGTAGFRVTYLIA